MTEWQGDGLENHLRSKIRLGSNPSASAILRKGESWKY